MLPFLDSGTMRNRPSTGLVPKRTSFSDKMARKIAIYLPAEAGRPLESGSQTHCQPPCCAELPALVDACCALWDSSASQPVRSPSGDPLDRNRSGSRRLRNQLNHRDTKGPSRAVQRERGRQRSERHSWCSSHGAQCSVARFAPLGPCGVARPEWKGGS